MQTQNVPTAKVVEKNYTEVVSEFDPKKILFIKYADGLILTEEWRDIPNYIGYFQVSSFGRVRSLERMGERKYRPFIVAEKILSQHKPQGYYSIALLKNGKRKTFRIHQLVAMAFLGHRLNGFKAIIDHKDNDPLNNLLNNLQITTNRHNASKDKKGYTSKYVGVNWKASRNKWRATIYHNGKDVHLGFFDDEKEASEYYQNALKSINNGTEIKIKRRTEASTFKGVGKRGKRWSATLHYSGKRKFLGVFDTELEAHQAVVKGEEEVRLGKPITVYRKETSSKHKGIRWDKSRNKWVLYINGKFTGRYETEEEAVTAKQNHFQITDN